MRNFREALYRNGLTDLGFSGFKFTWDNNRAEPENIRCRLDRAVANREWITAFPKANVTHLKSIRSDHAPILLRLLGKETRWGKNQMERIFRFESMWSSNNTCEEVIGRAWSEKNSFESNISKCSAELKLWGWNTFGSVKGDIKKMKMEILSLKEKQQTGEVKSRLKLLSNNLEKRLDQEEAMWKQRAKVQWLAEGDRNTKFFHSRASIRKKQNTIDELVDENGQSFQNQSELEREAVAFFQDIFSSCGPSDESLLEALNFVTGKVDHRINNDLTRPYTELEVKNALFDMFPTKAPGPDGMPALFYQKYWHIVGPSLSKCVLYILNHKIMDPNLNFTHIVLIPKCEKPAWFNQFRPISLSNVAFKVASKMITKRLKIHMTKIISESQSAFVPNRLITDNVLVAYEINHVLKRKTGGKKSLMALKLDMSKAYDRVEWKFLEATMVRKKSAIIQVLAMWEWHGIGIFCGKSNCRLRCWFSAGECFKMDCPWERIYSREGCYRMTAAPIAIMKRKRPCISFGSVLLLDCAGLSLESRHVMCFATQTTYGTGFMKFEEKQKTTRWKFSSVFAGRFGTIGIKSSTKEFSMMLLQSWLELNNSSTHSRKLVSPPIILDHRKDQTDADNGLPHLLESSRSTLMQGLIAHMDALDLESWPETLMVAFCDGNTSRLIRLLTRRLAKLWQRISDFNGPLNKDGTTLSWKEIAKKLSSSSIKPRRLSQQLDLSLTRPVIFYIASGRLKPVMFTGKEMSLPIKLQKFRSKVKKEMTSQFLKLVNPFVFV